MAVGKLPFYWGNKFWGERPTGNLYIKGQLGKNHPKWIDYKKLPNGGTDYLVTDAYEYKKYRLKLHHQIIDQVIFETPIEAIENPICLITSGGTASGKTSAMDLFVSNTLTETKESFVRIDFDRIKRSLPEYKYMFDKGIKEAAQYTQSESAKISGKLFKKAIKLRANIIFETTLSEPSTLVEERIKEMKKRNYSVYLIATHLKESIGQRRAVERFQAGGRYVPPSAISFTYQNCPASMKGLADKVDYLLLFDNHGAKQKLIFYRDNSTPVSQVIDGTAYASYLLDVGIHNDLGK